MAHLLGLLGLVSNGHATLELAVSVRLSIRVVFGQRPQWGQSPVEHRGTFVCLSIRLSIRLFVCPPIFLSPLSGLSGIKPGLSGPKSGLSALESGLSALESGLSDFKSGLSGFSPHRPLNSLLRPLIGSLRPQIVLLALKSTLSGHKSKTDKQAEGRKDGQTKLPLRSTELRPKQKPKSF